MSLFNVGEVATVVVWLNLRNNLISQISLPGIVLLTLDRCKRSTATSEDVLYQFMAFDFFNIALKNQIDGLHHGIQNLKGDLVGQANYAFDTLADELFIVLVIQGPQITKNSFVTHRMSHRCSFDVNLEPKHCSLIVEDKIFTLELLAESLGLRETSFEQTDAHLW
jgi:hypothetical protein